MTTDFTGSDAWHTTISGPATAQAVTAPSVCDMGLLVADRTIWLKNRIIGNLKQIELSILRSSSYTEVLNLVTTLGPSITSFADVPGFEITLANAVLEDDIIVCEATLVAAHKGDAISTDRLEMAITGAGTSGAVHVVSSDAGAWATTKVSHAEVRASGGAAPTIKLRTRCATSGTNDYAQLWGPWVFSVHHLRPIAAP